MTALTVSIDAAAYERLSRASVQLDRAIEDLAACAVEEAALAWERDNGGPLKAFDEDRR